MNEHFLPPYFQFALEGCLKVLPSQRGQVCSSTALCLLCVFQVQDKRETMGKEKLFMILSRPLTICCGSSQPS